LLTDLTFLCLKKYKGRYKWLCEWSRWFEQKTAGGSRKVIPKDVQEEYARRFGMRWEAHLRLPAETPRPIAKVQLASMVKASP
jgi:hypothetical protein